MIPALSRESNSDFISFKSFGGCLYGVEKIGVSDVVTDGANILEQLYPAPHRITAAGLGEGQAFRRAFPLVTYERISPGAALPFADQSFDIAVAMYVASVVPNPRRLYAELRRVVRPGGHILFVNHFIATSGFRLLVERGVFRPGDTYAITCGEPMGYPGGTNMLKICRVA